MTQNRNRKSRIRAEMIRTGRSYTAAARALDADTRRHELQQTHPGARHLTRLLATALEHAGTDVHLWVGAEPQVRVRGQLVDLGEPELTLATAIEIVEAVRAAALSSEEHAGYLDALWTLPGGQSARITARIEGESVSIVVRFPTPALARARAGELPVELTALLEAPTGLIVVCGMTGSGKSSVAEGLSFLAERAGRSCWWVEARPEWVREPDPETRTLRVGRDVPSIEAGLAHATSRGAAVVCVDEARTAADLAATLEAARTRLVILTLHTSSVPLALRRLAAIQPPEVEVEDLLAEVARGGTSISLHRSRPDLPHTASFQVLGMDPELSELVRTGSWDELDAVLARR